MNMNRMNLHQNGNANRVDVSLDDLELLTCECGSQHFKNVVKVGRLSSLHPKNPTNESMLADLPVKVCAKCGKELELDQ